MHCKRGKDAVGGGRRWSIRRLVSQFRRSAAAPAGLQAVHCEARLDDEPGLVA